MAESLSYACDVCAKRKLDTNHWFRAAIITFPMLRVGGGVVDSPPRLMIGRWDDPDFPKPQFHPCGAECLSKKTSAFAGGDVSLPGEKVAVA